VGAFPHEATETEMNMPGRMGGLAVLGAVCVGLAMGGCGRTLRGLGSVIDQLGENDSVAVRLVLIGDAGLPAKDGEPVLKALRNAIEKDADDTFVVFLGDNVYPRGLTDSTNLAERQEGERILQEQIDAVVESGARGVMVPGNHDWDAGAADGLEFIRRQDRWVDARGDGKVVMLPDNGCPGPHVIDFGNALRLLILDTQYWLQDGPRPEGQGFSCGQGGEEQVVDSLRTVLAGAQGRQTVVVGHHPLISGGEHGGYFDWPTYLFPFHPWARVTGVFAPQDVTGRDYTDMRRSLSRAFAQNPPLVFAAGHEHNLQVFRRGPAKYQLVSGAGIYNHTTGVRVITGHLYARRASGFMILTFLHDGRVRLSVQSVNQDGEASEDFSMWLSDVRPVPNTISRDSLPPPGLPDSVAKAAQDSARRPRP
jgi:hypothetical protein